MIAMPVGVVGPLSDFGDLLLRPSGTLVAESPETRGGEIVVPIRETQDVSLPPLTTSGAVTSSTIAIVQTFYIAATGTPYPVEMQLADVNAFDQDLTFSNWNHGVTPVAPSGARPLSYFTGRPGNTWFVGTVGSTSTSPPGSTGS